MGVWCIQTLSGLQKIVLDMVYCGHNCRAMKVFKRMDAEIARLVFNRSLPRCYENVTFILSADALVVNVSGCGKGKRGYAAKMEIV